MAYPASTKTLNSWVEEVDQMASNLKSSAQRQHDRSAAGTLDISMVARFFDELVAANNLFVAVASVTGIADHVKTQKGDSELNPVTEFNTMASAVISTLDWIRTNAPSDTFSSSTYYLAYALPTGNTTKSSLLTFTSGQTSTYRTVLNALIATIG